MAAGATTTIDIVAELTDNTAAGTASATRNVTKLEQSVKNLYTRLAGMKGKSKLEVKAELKDLASKGIQTIFNAGKKIAGKVWGVTVKLTDMATAPLKKLWSLASNPITQMVAFTGVSVGAADTLNTYKSFEQGMANVKAISGATGQEFQILTDTAKQLGETTQFSATQAAEAMENLAMAGWKSDAIVAGMPGLLDLAAAGSVDLATASDVTASALAQFKYDASESGRVADVLAATATNSKTDVQGLGESFKYAGSLAGALGYSIEDVALAFGLMGNNAIDASSAGTALRGLLARMAKQGELTEEESTAVAEAMKKVGVSMTTSGGKSKSLMTIMKDLRQGFSKLSEAEKTEVAANLAGQNAMSGLLAIVNASDEDFDKLTQAIGNSSGAAHEMAGIKMDTLQGSLYYLQSAAEGLQISIGEKISPYFKGAVDAITAHMPKIQGLIEDAIGWLDTKAQKFGGIIEQMTSTAEWEDADIGGKLNIAWDKLIAEPFTEWWESSGKNTIFRAIGSIFSEAGKILPGGEAPGLASWLSLGAIVKVAEPVVAGIGSIVKALELLPAPVANAGLAALAIASAVGVIKTAVESYNQTQISDNLEERFGEIPLSIAEAKEVAEGILTTPWTVNVDLALGELKNADKLRTDAETELKNMQKLEWKSSLGITLGEKDATAYMESANKFIEDKIGELEDLTYPAYINTSVFLGKTQEGEDLQSKIEGWAAEDIGELEGLSNTLRDLMQSAIEDGVIGVDEQAAIQELRNKMNNIVQGWYDSQSKAQMDLIKLKYGDMSAEELTEGGFRNLMDALNETNQTNEAKLDEDYTSYVGQLYSLRGSGHFAGKEGEAEFEKAIEIADQNYRNQQAQGRTESVQVALDTVGNAYQDVLAQNKEAMNGNIDQQIQNLQYLAQEGMNGRISNEIAKMASSTGMDNGHSQFLMFDWVSDADQAGLNSLLETMEPDATAMSSLMDKYVEAGKGVPEAFRDSYYSAMEMMASMGDSDAAMQTYFKRLADTGGDDLIKTLNDMLANGQLSDEVAQAWQRAIMGTTDEGVEMESPEFSLTGEPEIKNKDEWNQKLREKLEQDLSKGNLATVTGETETNFKVIVKKGDCLSTIGQAIGVDWHEIAEANGLSDPYTIYPEMELIIPKSSIQLDSSGVEESMQEAIQSLSSEGTGLEVTTEGVQVTFGNVEVNPEDTLEKIAAAVGTTVEALEGQGITAETIQTSIEAGVAVTIPQELVTVDTSGLTGAIEASMNGEGTEGGTIESTAHVGVEAGTVDAQEAYDTAQEETQAKFETPMETTGSTGVTLTQTNNREEIYNQTRDEVQSAYDVPMSARATVNVTLDWNLLNPNKGISVTGSGSGSGELHAAFSAEGRYVDGAMLSVIGEDGPEYVVPVGSKYRSRGLELWEQAGHDLGVPGFADGYAPDVPEIPEPVFEDTGEAAAGSGGSPTVVIENIDFDVNIDGSGAQDAQALADAIRENVRGMTDDIAYQIATALQQAYANTPRLAWEA